uniref:Uncharacterized protein n=1 Tax=Neospora caninum (strain Liverpool) TaxID=572307 RepID=A0A0F7UL20_NEOCL|nr:TPA: hypothetical protein BN1204_046025 [Neospora caninum Liverpool]
MRDRRARWVITPPRGASRTEPKSVSPVSFLSRSFAASLRPFLISYPLLSGDSARLHCAHLRGDERLCARAPRSPRIKPPSSPKRSGAARDCNRSACT